MTSKSASECFVYITLPGAVSAVTAGRFVLDKNRAGDPLGRFVYGRTYLENPHAVPIDPVELKLVATTYETVQLGGVFGALRDAGPDYWGRRVIEKHAGKPKLGEMDYLLESPDCRRLCRLLYLRAELDYFATLFRGNPRHFRLKAVRDIKFDYLCHKSL